MKAVLQTTAAGLAAAAAVVVVVALATLSSQAAAVEAFVVVPASSSSSSVVVAALGRRRQSFGVGISVGVGRLAAQGEGGMEDESTTSASASAAPKSRRQILSGGAALALLSAGGVLGIINPAPATAKVEGYAPPSSSSSSAKKALPEEYRQGTLSMSESDDTAPLPKESYKKLPSGLVYADIATGRSTAEKPADVGSKCNIQWVLRRGNGYFVDSSAVSDSVPFIWTVGDGTAIAGVDEGVRGMKAGGTRRLLIPVDMGYVGGLDDGKPGPLPKGYGPRQQMKRIQQAGVARKAKGFVDEASGDYIYLEIQLTRVR